MSKMPLQGQDLISLCATAAQNENLIVSVGKFALNIALSPNRAALDIAKGIAGIVLSGIASTSQRRNLAPGNSRYGNRRVSACEFIQNEMNEEQQQRLISRMSNVLGNRKQYSYRDLLAMIANNPTVRNTVVGEIRRFLEGENMTCSRSSRASCSCDDDEDDEYYETSSCCSSRSKSCSRY